jgi:hypothetical protein
VIPLPNINIESKSKDGISNYSCACYRLNK